MNTRTDALTIPIMTVLLVAAILLGIPVLRNIVVFAYLSFVPGFVILKALKPKELDLLKIFLLSVGLSLTASMFVGLLVNELYVILGLSQPLSIIPLTIAMSAFTVIVFLIGYGGDFSISSVSLDSALKEIRGFLPLTLALIVLPILGIVGALYANISIMIILYLTIAVLCVLSIASQKIIPTKSYPFLIFSISISILLLNLLVSKHIIGDDAPVEHYVFKVAQIRGHWGPIGAFADSSLALAFNSMLSVALLPNVYSVLMNFQDEMLFKILYSVIFSLVPVTLYGIYRSETGRSIGLLSSLFFVFSANAFFGDPIGANRQIVGEFFLMLSIFTWLDKALSIRQKRILLVVFGISIAVSHYSLTVFYLLFITLVVIITTRKPEFDVVYNVHTVLAIFGATFLWYAFSQGSVLDWIITTIQRTTAELTSYQGIYAGRASVMYGLPQVFTYASWINLAVSGVVTLSLVTGIPIVMLLSRRIGISDKYKWLAISAAMIFAVSLSLPMVAATMNFTRFYGIALLFLSPCFAMGALSFLSIIQLILKRISGNQKAGIGFLRNPGKTALLLIAVLLGAHFFSQIGFVNYATGGAFRTTYAIEYRRMEASNDPQVAVQFYGAYVPDHEASSADWLSEHRSYSSIVYADYISTIHVLVSCGLVPQNLIYPLTNTTKPEQGRFVYLDNLNVVKGIIPTPTGQLNTSRISPYLNGSNLIYSNGNSEIWIGPGSR